MLSHLKLPNDTTITADTFENCTLVHFHGCYVLLLTEFYKVRMVTNLSDKIAIPKKGSVEDTVAGVIDKKTNWPLPFSLAFNFRRMPVIGKVISLPPMVTPTLFIKPPTIFKYKTICQTALKETFDVLWVLQAHDKVASLRAINFDRYRLHYEERIDSHTQHANTLMTKLRNRLYYFLSSQIPPTRISLMPGIHWVWNSLHSKSTKLSMVMITSGHVVDSKDINCCTNEEKILTNYHNFVNKQSMNATEEYDGCYLVFDSKRKSFFRAGAAGLGMVKRWKEHQR